jgi:hypothetical protein
MKYLQFRSHYKIVQLFCNYKLIFALDNILRILGTFVLQFSRLTRMFMDSLVTFETPNNVEPLSCTNSHSLGQRFDII